MQMTFASAISIIILISKTKQENNYMGPQGGKSMAQSLTST